MAMSRDVDLPHASSKGKNRIRRSLKGSNWVEVGSRFPVEFHRTCRDACMCTNSAERICERGESAIFDMRQDTG